MPLGLNRSIVPYNVTNFTATDGTSYKSSLDAVTTIGANVSGPFFVYPTTPISMTVLVDSAYNFYRVGLSGFVNPSGGPNPIALATPLTNVTATIYWDFLLNIPGVVYGPSTGAIVMPDQAQQMPIALVFLTPTTTAISAANITDFRFVNSGNRNVYQTFIGATVNQSLNCYAAQSVSALITVTTAFSPLLTLLNLQVGVPVFIRFDNTSGTTRNLTIQAIKPSGTAYGVSGKSSAAATLITLTSGGLSTPSPGNTFFYGTSFEPNSLNFLIT